MISLLLNLKTYIPYLLVSSISSAITFGLTSLWYDPKVATLNAKIDTLTTQTTRLKFEKVVCKNSLTKSAMETKKANEAISDLQALYATTKKESKDYVKETCINGSEFNISIEL